MSLRCFPNWIEAYMKHASASEAPPRMHFWTGVSVIAGALRRKVWIQMKHFEWLPNFYIVFVARPGIVSKTTTMGIGMNLLKKVPGINFGPNSTSWQSLVKKLSEVEETFQTASGDWETMSALTIASGEFGNLITPADTQMIDALVALWDGGDSYDKQTKGNGNDYVKKPWINIIGCTTPAWMGSNFPEYMIGGGFASRTIFIYAKEKEKYIAYPDDAMSLSEVEMEKRLIKDLENMSLNLNGPLTLTKEAKEWGEVWYEQMGKKLAEGFTDDRMATFMARKQTHMHKLAMILSISRGNSMQISLQDLQEADMRLTEMEEDMPKVFALIGRSAISLQVDRLINFIHSKGAMPYSQAYRFVHGFFPEATDFDNVLSGAVKAGFLTMSQMGAEMWVAPTGKPLSELKLGE